MGHRFLAAWEEVAEGSSRPRLRSAPHDSIAFGRIRLLMLMIDAPSIRGVIAFP